MAVDQRAGQHRATWQDRPALTNLLPAGGRLGLRLRPGEAGGQVLVEVADGGEGMDEAHAARAGER